MREENYFSGSMLDRRSELRSNTAYLQQTMRDEATKYVLFHNCNPLVENLDEAYKLIHFAFKDICMIEGFDKALSKDDAFQWPDFLLYLGEDVKNINWFAVNVQKEDPIMKTFLTNTHRLIAAGYKESIKLTYEDAAIVAQAKSIFHWLDRYKFCPTCGTPMCVDDAGYKRTCLEEKCRSNKGVHNTCYPRTDPTAIMCVVSKDGNKCLLGRKSRWPKKHYSCLAGFMEPGESIEETVCRETKEESGIIVESVRYISSQPWPFPSSLMIGCLATASTEEISVNEEEMEDVQWFSMETVTKALHGKCDSLRLPPKQAIAHQLVKYWISSFNCQAKSCL